MKQRREFSPATRREALERAGYACEGILADGQRCGAGPPFEFDHDIPDREFGLNDLENCKVLCVLPPNECHKRKTKRDRQRRDLDIAREKHRDDRRKPGKIKGRPMAGTKASGIRKRMDGTVERRT